MINLSHEIQSWPLANPFRITGYSWEAIDVVVAKLSCDGKVGTGEAAGVYYLCDTAARIHAQLANAEECLRQGVSLEGVLAQLPAGGARNALDCAYVDLRAKLDGRPAWHSHGLPEPRPLVTTFTCGADSPERMAHAARKYRDARAIKLKLTGDVDDAERVRAVWQACPNVWLGIDANQGFDRAGLDALIPTLIDCSVALIEQPFPRGSDDLLEGWDHPIPIAADESFQEIDDLSRMAGRYEYVNIKLDKCGGFRNAMAILDAAPSFGLRCMVGNMIGTSLAMAPAYLVGQRCELADLDGAILLARDRPGGARYDGGTIDVPAAMWGAD